MAGSLRKYMASWSWRSTVIVGGLGYLAFINVGPRLFPSMASWPWDVRVVLSRLARIMPLILAVLASPFAIRAGRYISRWERGLKLDTRSDKAKEKLADSLMSVGTAIHSATLVAILVFPVTAFISLVARGTDPLPADALDTLLRGDWLTLPTWVAFGRWVYAHLLFTALFTVTLLFPALFGSKLRLHALDIYDALPRPAASPSLALTPVPVQDRPTVLSKPVEDVHDDAGFSS
jgi:hypothetical protein